MYHPAIVKRKLDAIAPKLPFTLKEYSVSHAAFLTKHLKDLATSEPTKHPFPGKPGVFTSRALKPEEWTFIRNERIICKNSFLYTANRYLWIKSTLMNEQDSVVRFNLTSGQKIVFSVIQDLELRGLAILLMLLKARQLGASTLIEVIIAYLTAFQTYVNAVVGSSDPDKSKKMAKMMTFVWEQLPYWLSPDMQLKESQEAFAEMPGLHNGVTRQHGTQFSGIARGDTPTVFHLSEIPDYADPDEDIEASLLRAVHESPNTLGVLESTAKGIEGYWPDKWEYATKNWHLGKSRLCPVFLGWFLGTDLYPTKTWLKGRAPQFVTWEPSATTAAHADKVKNYVRSSALYRRFLGDDYVLPREQQFFYEFDRQEHEEADRLAKFLEEMPATPEEAFQMSGRGVFGVDVVDRLRTEAYARGTASWQGQPAIFSLEGPGIPRQYQVDPRELDNNRAPIPITSSLGYGVPPRKYLLRPVKPPDVYTTDGLGYVFIYEFPDQRFDYATGVDCAEGLGSDRTAMAIIRKGTIALPSVQVLEFAHDIISANEFTPWADALGAFYSFRSGDRVNECKQVIEVNNGGNGLQHELKKLGWTNWHDWEASMDVRGRKRRHTASKIGWQTNAWTRPWLVGEVKYAILSDHFVVNSPFLISELATLAKDEYNSNRIEASGTRKDDRFFAAGMAYFSLNIWEIQQRLEKGARLDDPFNPTTYVDTVAQNLHDLSQDPLPTLDDFEGHAGVTRADWLDSFIRQTNIFSRGR